MLVGIIFKAGSHTVKPLGFYKLTSCLSIRDLFKEITSGKLDCGDDWVLPSQYVGKPVVAKLSKEVNSSLASVPMDATVTEVMGFGPYITFFIEPAEQQTRSSKNGATNAFTVLMNSARSRSLLPTKKPGKTKKDVLFNRLVDLLEECNVGYSQDTIRSGTGFTQALCDLIWLIDPHVTQRSIKVPDMFKPFLGLNDPHAHKHKAAPLTCLKLTDCKDQLCSFMHKPWMSGVCFIDMKEDCERFISEIEKLVGIMTADAERHRQLRDMNRDLSSDTTSISVIKGRLHQPPEAHKQTLLAIRDALNEQTDFYSVISINSLLPECRFDRYQLLRHIKTNGFYYDITLYTKLLGGNLEALHFIWRVDKELDSHDSLQAQAVKTIDTQLPSYHHKAIKKAFTAAANKLHVKPSHRRLLFNIATNDATAPANHAEKQINEKLAHYLDTGDESIVLDLRELNKRPAVFEQFFDKAAKYIQSEVETAVDDRRHGGVVHMALALSADDLHRRITESLADEHVPIPSLSWFRMQFSPKNLSYKASRNYTGRLKVKHMVQQRQLRNQHVDDHYGSALFRYLKEFCVRNVDFTDFVSVDDKCKVDIGEPGFPIAAVERGKKVLVGLDSAFTVGDHDFSRCSLTPSVTFRVNIPETVDGSWYSGSVNIALKDTVFQPSSPFRHAAELVDIMKDSEKEILCIYSDGGPDHRCTYLSVMMSMIYVWSTLKLDMLVLARTPPGGSWRNPAERVMSQLNLGLQTVGLMREEAGGSEDKLKRCNTMKSIRAEGEKSSDFKNDFQMCVQPPRDLVNSVFQRLSMNGEPFEVTDPATNSSVQAVIDKLRLLFEDDTLETSDTKAKLKNHPAVEHFLESHCVSRHYHFSVKKCGSTDCDFCTPVRLYRSIFNQLNTLPDPTPDDSGEHYKAFADVYGTDTVPDHRPGLTAKAKTAVSSGVRSKGTSEKNQTASSSTVEVRSKRLMNAQQAVNTRRVLVCLECDKPRVVYAEQKLTLRQVSMFDAAVEQFDFVCGTNLPEIAEVDRNSQIFSKVYMKDLLCADSIETAYYSSKIYNVNICRQCAQSDADNSCACTPTTKKRVYTID